MDNVTFVTHINPFTGEAVDHAIIDRGNGEFTSMPAKIWYELEAAKENGTIS